MKTKKNYTRTVGLVVMVLALLVMQSGPVEAQSPGQNYGAVKATVGATAAMYGAAAAAGVCTVVTAGACGAIVGGVALGGIGATLAFFPPPQPPIDWHNGNAYDMPDYVDWDGGGSGGDEACAGGGVTPFGIPAPESFGCD